MKSSSILLLAGLIGFPACASTGSPAPSGATPVSRAEAERRLPDPLVPAGDPARYIGDPALYGILNNIPFDGTVRAALDRYEYRSSSFMDRIGEVAEDSSASVAARLNALAIIGERRPARSYYAVRAALHAEDPRVRVAALNAASHLYLSGIKDAAVLLRDGLDDASPEVQAKALQFSGDADIMQLRRMAASPGTTAEVRSIVRGLIQAAEERGAALVPDERGMIERTSATGHTMRFTPTTQWKQWDAAVGRVTVRTAQGLSIEIAGDIEVVANVVPLFFSPDGRYMVYETGRHIRVRDLTNGTERDAGPGIAPRIRPVTEEFLYAREDVKARANQRDRVQVSYDIMSAPFAATPGTEPQLLAESGAFLQQSIHGNYAPVRWMRVEDRDGAFYLRGETMEVIALPSPFGGS